MAVRKRKAPKRLPSNVVIEAVAAAGGQTAVLQELGVSAPTLARWRKAGKIEHDSRACLELARLAALGMREDEWALARRLAGLD
jgi:DNA-binding transcriptional regulator YdaS (Cro superfamily)